MFPLLVCPWRENASLYQLFPRAVDRSGNVVVAGYSYNGDLHDASAYYTAKYAAADGASRDRILGWLPLVAAARLAEGVPDEVDGLLAMVGPA